MRTLVIAVAQPAVVAHDVAGNAHNHASAVRSAGAQVVVFPEMSITGYELDAELVDPDDLRLAPIIAACRELGSTAFVGAPVAGVANKAHIGTLMIDGGGASVAYRKRFLGDDETVRYRPGGRAVVVAVSGWRLGLAICRDTGVARHAKDAAGLGAEIYLAGAVESEADRDVQPSRARRIARRHDMWVAVASFAGSTGGGYEPAAGRSGIWRPDGSMAGQAGPTTGEIVVAAVTDDHVGRTADERHLG